MRTPHSLPKRRGLTVAVQLALTFAAGMYAPRIRAQQIACPASGLLVTGSATNTINACNVTGGLTIDSGATLSNASPGVLTTTATGVLTVNNAGSLQNGPGAALTNEGLLFNSLGGTLINGGTLTSTFYRMAPNPHGPGGVVDRGLVNEGALTNTGTLITRGVINSGTISSSGAFFASNISKNYGSLLSSGTLDISDRFYNEGSIVNDSSGTLTNSGALFNRHLIDNAGTLINNSALLSLRLVNQAGGVLINNSGIGGVAGSTLTNFGRLDNNGGMDLSGNGLRNRLGATLNNAASATLTLRDGARLASQGTLNNDGSLVIEASPGGAFNGYGGGVDNYGAFTNSGVLTNHSNGTNPFTNGGLNNLGTITNNVGLLNFGFLVNVQGTLINNGILQNAMSFDGRGGIGKLYNRMVSTITNNGALANYWDGTFDNYGTLNNSAGATIENLGAMRNWGNSTLPLSGKLNNDGTLNNLGTLTNNAFNGGVLGILNNNTGALLRNGGTLINGVNGVLNNTGHLYNYGTLTNNGTLTSGALSYGGLYGALDGGLVNSGTLTNTRTLTTLGVINSGTLSSSGTFTNNGLLKNYAQLDNLSGGGLTTSGALVNHGTLSNAGALTITVTGGLSNYVAFGNLAGGVVDNSGSLANYTGATATNTGTFNNSGYLRNLAGATFDNQGTLNNNLPVGYGGIYNRGTLISSGTLNNAGRIYNINGATLANSGTLNNTHIIVNEIGATIANSGTLNNSWLLFNPGSLSNSGTLNNSGTLSNFGTLTNSGTLVNNGNLFSNGAIENGGTFVVASPVNGPLGTFTQSAGVLEGNSSLTQSTVAINGGVLRPGAAGAPGTLTITGTLTLGAGAVLEINATPAQTSRVTVNGAASVAGTVELVAGAGTYPSTPQTILSATGGVTGTFSGVTTASAFLTPSLSYDPNTVFLSFYQSATFDSVAMTPNQAAVSRLLGAVQSGGGASADLQAALGMLSGMSAEQARATYDSLAAAANTSAAFNLQFDVADGFVRTLANRLGGATSGGITAMLPVQVASAGSSLNLSPAATARDGAWVLAYGNHGKTDGDENASGYRQDGAGVAFGADTSMGEGWRVGGAVNIGTQRAKLEGGGGDVRADGVSVAAYARFASGALTVDGMAGVGRNGNESTRTIGVGGMSRTARADYDSDQQFAHLELTIKGWRLEPVAGLGYIRVDSPAYTETGAGGLSLAVDGQARESIKSYLGARYVHELGGSLKLAARALWTHEFGDADSALATARFTGAPAAGAFQAVGVDLKRDGALLGVGLSGELKRNLSLFGDVSVEARQGQWNASLFAGARFTW